MKNTNKYLLLGIISLSISGIALGIMAGYFHFDFKNTQIFYILFLSVGTLLSGINFIILHNKQKVTNHK